MTISRENYEIWFVDWLDNRLSDEELVELNFFLDRNPDVRDEFNDLCTFILKPVPESVPSKESLKKDLSDFPGNQFEILCAASVENDLDAWHLAELNEMASADPVKAGTLQIFRRLKLSAPEKIHYKDKKKLFKTTPAQKVIRIAWIGLSAAAVVAILFMTGVMRQHNPSGVNPVLAGNNPVQLPPEVNDLESDSSGEQLPTEIEEPTSPGYREAKPGVKSGSGDKVMSKPVVEKEHMTAPGRIAFNSRPEVIQKTEEQRLMTYMAEFIPPEESDPDDGRSNIGRFMSRHFRSKILDEETPSDAPLKGYEIAEAGIDGLNKLLGWEMALTKRTDENGEVKSLNFNSRMLKFNTPVKNNSSEE